MKYPESTSEKFPNVKVKLDLEKNDIVFNGDNVDIQSLKLDLYSILLSFFACTSDNIPEDINFFSFTSQTESLSILTRS